MKFAYKKKKSKEAVKTELTLQEKKRKLEQDRLLLERDKHIFETESPIEKLEQELEQMGVEIAEIQNRNKKRWKRIWCIWLVLLALGIGSYLYISYAHNQKYQETLVQYGKEMEPQILQAETKKQELQQELELLKTEVEEMLQ